MGQFTRNLKQDVTHWAVTPNGFGGYTFAAPVALKGRWEQKAVLFQTPEGKEEVSNAIVFVNLDVELEDYLFLGVSVAADPTLISDTWLIRQFLKTPDLRNLDHERKVIL